MKPFKIRCSAIGRIMTNSSTGNTSKVLSKTTQSYCDLWIKEQLYKRSHSFSNKYTEKGCIVEDESIDFIAEQLGLGFLIKNEQFFEDEYKTGTPDMLPPNLSLVLDAKNSWNWETFPLLEEYIPTKDYWWQLQGYMDLTGRENAKLVYVLSDTPQNLIEREARRYCYNSGFEELDLDIYKDFEKEMTYRDVPDSLRKKEFDIKRDNDAIQLINQRVVLCRQYIDGRLKQLNIK